ncbi:MAG: D-alanyl-D-alanine carboxypeptidase/D-alanyl-D-alanine-endopeptidase [Planctomycetota bacterium]|nr:MAG: D-alanyl-D-alanine carboxypeptidase/D-alanyl-D-alanine-endopeptidase [Planctomycetota bacterium]
MCLATLLACLLVSSTPAPTVHTPRASISAAVQDAARKSGLPSGTYSIVLKNADTGETITAIEADRPMKPASNMKLFSTGTALMTLGTEFLFRTQLLCEFLPAGDRLTVVGDGDPAFGDPDLLSKMSWTAQNGEVRNGVDATALVDIWVDAVRGEKITKISELVIDARIFDDVGYQPHWPREQYSNGYCAEVWGLNFHANVVHVIPAPRAGGAPAIASMSPAMPWLVTSNKATSRTGAKDKHTFTVVREPNSNALTLGGNAKVQPRDAAELTLHDTPTLFGELLADRLRKQGVTVARVRKALVGEPAAAGTQVGPVIQTPIATVLKRANTESSNLYAESLCKRAGAARTKTPGSWSNGTATIAEAIQLRLGPSALSGFVVDDGSGLSAANRVTARVLCDWIVSFANDPKLAQPFIESMAEAGESGTVQKRFKDLAGSAVTVHCKTGYIRGTSCLSGIAIAPNGTRIAFSVLGNSLEQADRVDRAKRLQDAVVRAIHSALVESNRNSVNALGG